jgi:hypothetical protein
MQALQALVSLSQQHAGVDQLSSIVQLVAQVRGQAPSALIECMHANIYFPFENFPSVNSLAINL